MVGVVGVLLRNCGEVRILTDFYPVPYIDWFLYPVLYMYMYNNFNWFFIDFIFILSHTLILFLSCQIHWFYFYPDPYIDFIFTLSHTLILFLSCPIQWFDFYPVLYIDWFLSCYIHWFYFDPDPYIDFIFILLHTLILFLSWPIHWFDFYPDPYIDFIFILLHTLTIDFLVLNIAEKLLAGH